MVSAILFDLFETLVTESASPPPRASSLAVPLGCEPEAFRDLWRIRRPAVITGRIAFRQALQEIVTLLGSCADAATLDRLRAERICAKALAFEEVEPSVLALLGGLRSRGLRLAVVSNCFEEDVTAWPLSPLAPLIDVRVFSYEVGRAKPDPEIYREAIRRLGVDPARACFIGDGGDGELAGAGQAGLRAFRALWFARRWPAFREPSGSDANLATVDDVVRLLV